jgi:hypothetical protein
MIEKNLDELGKYAEEIKNEEPLKLIEKYFSENEFNNLNNIQLEIEKDFQNDIVKVINNYKDEGIPDKMISSYLFDVLIIFIKKSLIEQKANELDIDSNLYKNEMRFLFKGKWK